MADIKYSKINLSVEAVQTLMKMSSDLKDRYDEYVKAGNDLGNRYETLYKDLGIDADPVRVLLDRLNVELTLNCEELLNLGEYCEKLAKIIEAKMGKKIVAHTNFI